MTERLNANPSRRYGDLMSESKMDKYTRAYIRRYGWKGYVYYDGYNSPGRLFARTLNGARKECIRSLRLDDYGIGIYKVTDKSITFAGDICRFNGSYKIAAGNYWEPNDSFNLYEVNPNTGGLMGEAQIDHKWDGKRRLVKFRRNAR